MGNNKYDFEDTNGYNALALCGGGGKGSYQIGVWGALEDLGITKGIKAVSGTSVGALNAVLFAIGDFSNAKQIWNHIRPDDLLSMNENPEGEGLFSREGLISIIKSVPLYKLRTSIPVYINISDAGSNIVRSVQINELTEAEIMKYLLASSAMPVAYDAETIQGKKYIDGGVTRRGNVPIEILYKKGYKNILISALNYDFSFNDIFDRCSYPDINVKVLQPLENIGNLITGTLDFSQSGVSGRMVCGYRDTMKIIRQENLMFMKKNYVAINIALENKMKELFHSQEDIEEFIKKSASIFPHNTDWPVMDIGAYTKPVEMYGWTLQQGKINNDHYRLVDSKGIRRAWVLDPELLFSALENYGAAKKIVPK